MKIEFDLPSRCYCCCEDGSAWHPFVSANERLYSFSSDLCRSIYLTCDKNCSKNLDVPTAAIPVYRFMPPEEVFADSKTNPDNQGFCVSSPCFESGVLDVSTCRNGKHNVDKNDHLVQYVELGGVVSRVINLGHFAFRIVKVGT